MNSVEAHERARAILRELEEGGRKALKRLSRELDGSLSDVRRAIITESLSRGVVLPNGADEWPSKKLLRRALGRAEKAQERHNPIARDEDFECVHCGGQVRAHGRTARDHCPSCLRSRHLDIIPGDRKSECGGVMDPTGLGMVKGTAVISYICRSCGHTGRVRALEDGNPPDDAAKLRTLSAKGRT